MLNALKVDIFADSFGGGPVCKKCQPITVNVCSWSSTVSYVGSQDGSMKFSGNPIVVKKQLLQKRQVLFVPKNYTLVSVVSMGLKVGI